MKKIVFAMMAFTLLALSACGTPTAEQVTTGMVGAEAPDFTLESALGGQTSLSDYEGEPVLLFFHMAVG